MNSSGELNSDDERALNDMMSRDSQGKSYSVEVDISQIMNHNIDSSIHYVSKRSSNSIIGDENSLNFNNKEEELKKSEKDDFSLKFDSSDRAGLNKQATKEYKSDRGKQKAFFSEKENDGEEEKINIMNKNSLKFSVTSSKQSNLRSHRFQLTNHNKELNEGILENLKNPELNETKRAQSKQGKNDLNLSKIESEKNLRLDQTEEKVFKSFDNNNSKLSIEDNQSKINEKYEDNIKKVMKRNNASISIHDFGDDDYEGSDTIYLFGGNDEGLELSKDTNKKKKFRKGKEMGNSQ